MNMNEFYACRDGVSLFWIGNDGWVINFFGTFLAFDPDLHSPGRVPLPECVDPLRMAGALQAVFVTHWHGDHFHPETCRFLMEHGSARFVLSASCDGTAREAGLPEDRIIYALPDMPFDTAGLRVTPMRALHGHLMGSVYRGASLRDCGYVVEKNGFRIYQPGDTVLLHEHFEMPSPDLAFFSPTEHNMHITNSLRFLGLLHPRFILPQHYDSYTVTEDNAFWTRGFPDEVYVALPPDLRRGYRKPKQGEVIRLL